MHTGTLNASSPWTPDPDTFKPGSAAPSQLSRCTEGLLYYRASEGRREIVTFIRRGARWQWAGQTSNVTGAGNREDLLAFINGEQ